MHVLPTLMLVWTLSFPDILACISGQAQAQAQVPCISLLTLAHTLFVII